MKTPIKAICLLALFSAIMTTAKSQNQSVFNQNGLNSKTMMNSDPWSFGINTSGLFGLKSNDETLFRGNSIATKLFARYYFGKMGLGFTSGIAPGAISSSALTSFMADRKFPQDQLQISKENPSNNYLLFGPSFRFGGKVYVNTDIQGGLFFNNPGSVNITKPGDTRSLYRFDGGDKNVFPGFSGSISINYPINSSTYFFINTDYLQSKSSVRLLDPQSGIDVPAQVNRDVKLFTAGIGILKSFGKRRSLSGSKAIVSRNIDYEEFLGNTPATASIIHNRDAQSGLPTGKRMHLVSDPKTGLPIGKRMRMLSEPKSGLPTGKRMHLVSDPKSGLPTGKRMHLLSDPKRGLSTGKRMHMVSDPKSGLPTGKRMRMLSDPKTGLPIGKRMHMVSDPKSGLPTGKRMRMLSDPKTGLPIGKRIRMSQPDNGNTTESTNENCGPVTLSTTKPDGTMEQITFACPADAAEYSQQINLSERTKTLQQEVPAGNVSTDSGTSATGVISGTIKWSKGYTSDIVTNETAIAKVMNNPEDEQGVVTTIYARESVRGKTTEKRQHLSVYDENDQNICVDCPVNAKLLAHEATHVAQQSSGIKKNPLYQDNGSQGTNPMHEAKGIQGNGGQLCGTTSHFIVILSDPDDGKPVAKTTSDACGNFWFANVPVGNYSIRVLGEVLVQKAYEVTINKTGKYDVAGEMFLGENQLEVQLYSAIEKVDSQKGKVVVRGWDPQKSETASGAANKNSTQPGSLQGGVPTGGTILTTAYVAGGPIGGIIVKGGKNPGGHFRTTQTNENGEFEFTGLEKGIYTFSTEILYDFDEETFITVGGNAMNNVRKGWDGSVKGSSMTDKKSEEGKSTKQ